MNLNNKKLNKLFICLTNLDTERVKDHTIHGSDIEVKDHKAQRMQTKHHIQELPWLLFNKHFDIGMAFRH